MNLDQEKRVMLAFALSIVMLVLYRVYVIKEPAPQPKKSSPVSATTHAGPAVGTPKATSTAAPSPVALPVLQGAQAEEVVVEGRRYRVTLSTVGAVVRSWGVKDPSGEPTETIDTRACEALGFPLSVDGTKSVKDVLGLLTGGVGSPDIARVVGKNGVSFSMSDDQERQFRQAGATDELIDALKKAPSRKNLPFNQAVYVLKAYRGDIKPAGEQPTELSGNTFTPPVKLTFTYSDGKVQVTKQFSFSDSYSVQAEVGLFDGHDHLPVEVAWPGGFGDQSPSSANATLLQRAVYETPDESKPQEVTLTPSLFGRFFGGGTAAASGAEPQQDIASPVVLTGLEDRFFAGIFLSESSDAKARIIREVWSPPNWQGDEKNKPRPLDVSFGNTSAKTLDFRLFVGPKALDVLKASNPPLDSLIDFGWFSIVAKPLFFAMRYIHDHWIHNYGWAIVLLTLIITMAMFPLKLKSLRSAQEMQKVAPIVKGIQDKYKNYKFNDPRKQKMNEEVMKVYSEHGINPLGGCLPMLVQLPFLYGFYRVLDLAIELRHAPWIFWIKDLSAPDRLVVMGLPIPVLVILMTVASFILQRMTPMASVDPSQQRMMMFMPIFFAFMFYRLASGMVLYWLVSSTVQILQQVFINRRMPPPTLPPVPRKAAVATRG